MNMSRQYGMRPTSEPYDLILQVAWQGPTLSRRFACAWAAQWGSRMCIAESTRGATHTYARAHTTPVQKREALEPEDADKIINQISNELSSIVAEQLGIEKEKVRVCSCVFKGTCAHMCLCPCV